MSRAPIVDALLARLRAPRQPPVAANAMLVFNPALAQALALDPAVSALLGDMRLPMAVDAAGVNLFRVTERGTLLLSPALLSRPALLGVAVRWAQEAAFLMRAGAPAALASAARHGAALIASLLPDARAGLRAWLPDPLWNGEALAHGEATRRWLAEALGAADPLPPCGGGLGWGVGSAWTTASGECAGCGYPPPRPSPTRGEGRLGGELSLPVEALLQIGGDARIVSSPETGVNRYGAASRPRPQAVHFSSSTASSVSDYAFAALDRLRRALLVDVLFDELSTAEAVERLANAIGRELLRLHGLSAEEADVVLAPSGTDTELLAVLMSLGAGPRIANILVAPLETGRSVLIAAAGLRFQEGSTHGAKIWPDADIDVASVAVRGADGRPAPHAQIEKKIARVVSAGLADGRRGLLHVLLGSKTGINAPSPEFVAGLAAPGERIDVVADSCQGRYDAPALGRLVRAGWMAQITGSKFFTGPPFSGALLVPARLRERREAVARRLAQAPELASTSYWPAPWRRGSARSFGPLLRWTGALIEAELFGATEPELAREAFAAFSAALRRKLAACRYLVAIDPPENANGPPAHTDFAGRSILCFAPQAADGRGGLRRLGFQPAERLFRWLNADVEARLAGLDPVEAALARQPMHIGQPVDLTPGSDPPNVILRLVIGARFFSTVAMAGPQWRAALDAEIADGERALDKAELLLARWEELG